MSIFSQIGDIFEDLWENLSKFFHTDVEPAFKLFFQQFASDEGKLIFEKAVKYAPQLITGKFSEVVPLIIKELISESTVIAAQNYEKTVQQVQSALQVAKVASNIATPADQKIAATIAEEEGAIAAPVA